MGAHHTGSVGVRGSSPLCSTKKTEGTFLCLLFFLQRKDLNPRGSERKENNSANCFQRGAVRRVLLRSNGRRAISMQGEAAADAKSPMLHQKTEGTFLCLFFTTTGLEPERVRRIENNPSKTI